MNQSCIESFISIINISFRYSSVSFLKDFAPVLDLIFKPSCLFSKSYFHIYSYTQPVVPIVVVIVVSMLFSFFDSNKKMKQKRMQKTKLEIGVFSFVAFGALCSYYSKMVELVSWMSFLFTRIGLMKRTHFAHKKLQQRNSSCNRFLLTWIHFQYYKT